jgi:2,3-bisphosphoglycerate-dependent phosphoglycerate mutase
MSRVMLIRHAQSANNAKPEHERVSDPDLTELGRAQAEATARALSSYTIKQLYCSPFLRALETTRPIARGRDCSPFIHCELFEQGGCYSGHLPGQKVGQPGMGCHELANRYSGWCIDPRIAEQGWWSRPYESAEESLLRAGRVRQWLEAEVIDGSDSLVTLVIHADFKRHLLMQLLGPSWSSPIDRQLGPLHNAGISLLEYSQSNWLLLSYNSTSHLSSNLLSD